MKETPTQKIKLYTLALFILLIYGCIKPDRVYKYTIWQGTAVFATGIECDSYQEKSGYILFKGVEGKLHIIPKNQLKEIEVNF